MDISRRSLFVLGAAGVGSAGLGAVSTTAAAAFPGQAPPGAGSPAHEPPGFGLEPGSFGPTNHDRAARRQNPANMLGCPLGRGV